MAVIRRNGNAIGILTFALAVFLVSWHLQVDRRHNAVAQGPDQQAGEIAATRFAAVRHDAALDNDALASINPDQEQLERICATINDWAAANADDVKRAQAAVGNARALIRHYAATIKTGTEATADLRAARQALALAETNYDTLLATLRAEVDDTFSQSQRSVAEARTTSPKLAMPYRVLAVSAKERAALRSARSRYQQLLNCLADARARAACKRAYSQQVIEILGPQAPQRLGVLRKYLPGAAELVVATTQEAFPSNDDS